jgi:hypothetical protein
MTRGDRRWPQKLSRARRTPLVMQTISDPYQFPFFIAQGTGFRLRPDYHVSCNFPLNNPALRFLMFIDGIKI